MQPSVVRSLQSFLKLFDDLFESSIASQGVPTQTEKLAIGWTVRDFGHLFEQVDGTIGLSGAHQDFGSDRRIRRPLHCILVFWRQLDRLLAFPQGSFHLTEITMNKSQVRDLQGMITRT